jgi:hypothetical protein
MNDALTLYRLQELDTQIDNAKARLAEIDKALSDDSRVRAAQKQLEKAEAQAKEIRIALHQIEDKAESQRIKRKTTQASLFSGKIKNPKELQDLQMESEALKRYIATLEDEQLEAMIANETAEKAVSDAQKALNEAKARAAEENASLLGEKVKLDEDLPRLQAEKKAVLPSVSQATLEQYQRLRKTKRGLAVAAVTDGGCSLCGHSLTPAELQTIRGGSKVVTCPSCGRILYGG